MPYHECQTSQNKTKSNNGHYYPLQLVWLQFFFYVYVYWNILIQYNQKEKEKLALRTLCFSLV
jgi:hypothetical protein